MSIFDKKRAWFRIPRLTPRVIEFMAIVVDITAFCLIGVRLSPKVNVIV